MQEQDAYRTIFLFVSGRTPQVITETLFFFTVQHQPPLIPHEIHVVTTTEGKSLIQQQLLTPKTGQFYRLCRDYDLPADRIRFAVDMVDVLEDPAGVPLTDLRTDADNRAAADQIIAKVRALTSDPHTRLLASMAGGRKTMGLYLGFALQFYGRPQDRLTHVLISPPELENNPAFFYPASRKTSRLKAAQRTSTIAVTEVPFLLLGHKLPVLRDRADLGYAALVTHSQHEVDLLTTLAPITIDQMKRQLCIGGKNVLLSGLEFALYSFLAEKKLRASCALDCPGCEECTVQTADFLKPDTIATLERLAATGGARDPRLRQLGWWAKEGDEGKKRFLQVCARIKKKAQSVLGDASRVYVIAPLRDRRRRTARYTIPLNKSLLQFAELATLPPR